MIDHCLRQNNIQTSQNFYCCCCCDKNKWFFSRIFKYTKTELELFRLLFLTEKWFGRCLKLHFRVRNFWMTHTHTLIGWMDLYSSDLLWFLQKNVRIDTTLFITVTICYVVVVVVFISSWCICLCIRFISLAILPHI